ncbi:MAG: hypothetical protein ACKERG_00545 [Candidatus Hodgkinia cicadicola]
MNNLKFESEAKRKAARIWTWLVVRVLRSKGGGRVREKEVAQEDWVWVGREGWVKL